MKILQIAGNGTVGTADAGPVSSVITQLANELAKAGHEVGVADTLAVNDRPNLHPAIAVHELPSREPQSPAAIGLEPLTSVVRARSDFRSLVHHFRHSQYDVVHVHEPASALTFPRRHSGTLLWTVHGLNWTMKSSGNGDRAGPRARLIRLLDISACKRVSHIVVLNNQTRNVLPYPNVSVIPNGIDLCAWPTISQSEARDQLAIPRDDFLVTFVGRIAPEKGVDVYVSAIEKVARRIPLKADAIGSLSGVFGTSSHVTDFAARVRSEGPNTMFRGFIHRDEPEYRMRLAAADLVIIPSITEPFGLVVLEALACGARVIGSDVGGIRDILADGRGILVALGDSDILATTIERRYLDKRRGGARNECRADLRNYQWCRIGTQYSELMQSLATSG